MANFTDSTKSRYEEYQRLYNENAGLGTHGRYEPNGTLGRRHAKAKGVEVFDYNEDPNDYESLQELGLY